MTDSETVRVAWSSFRRRLQFNVSTNFSSDSTSTRDARGGRHVHHIRSHPAVGDRASSDAAAVQTGRHAAHSGVKALVTGGPIKGRNWLVERKGEVSGSERFPSPGAPRRPSFSTAWLVRYNLSLPRLSRSPWQTWIIRMGCDSTTSGRHFQYKFFSPNFRADCCGT